MSLYDEIELKSGITIAGEEKLNPPPTPLTTVTTATRLESTPAVELASYSALSDLDKDILNNAYDKDVQMAAYIGDLGEELFALLMKKTDAMDAAQRSSFVARVTNVVHNPVHAKAIHGSKIPRLPLLDVNLYLSSKKMIKKAGNFMYQTDEASWDADGLILYDDGNYFVTDDEGFIYINCDNPIGRVDPDVTRAATMLATNYGQTLASGYTELKGSNCSASAFSEMVGTIRSIGTTKNPGIGATILNGLNIEKARSCAQALKGIPKNNKFALGTPSIDFEGIKLPPKIPKFILENIAKFPFDNYDVLKVLLANVSDKLTIKDLQAYRDVRKAVRDYCKKFTSLNSLVNKGASTNAKWVWFVLMYGKAEHSIALGHSDINHWGRLLNVAGIQAVSSSILGEFDFSTQTQPTYVFDWPHIEEIIHEEKVTEDDEKHLYEDIQEQDHNDDEGTVKKGVQVIDDSVTQEVLATPKYLKRSPFRMKSDELPNIRKMVSEAAAKFKTAKGMKVIFDDSFIVSDDPKDAYKSEYGSYTTPDGHKILQQTLKYPNLRAFLDADRNNVVITKVFLEPLRNKHKASANAAETHVPAQLGMSIFLNNFGGKYIQPGLWTRPHNTEMIVAIFNNLDHAETGEQFGFNVPFIKVEPNSILNFSSVMRKRCHVANCLRNALLMQGYGTAGGVSTLDRISSMLVIKTSVGDSAYQKPDENVLQNPLDDPKVETTQPKAQNVKTEQRYNPNTPSVSVKGMKNLY